MVNNDSCEYCALKIRRLAASCQQGGSCDAAKEQVKTVIESYKNSLGKNASAQARGWSELFDCLGVYLNNSAAPEWSSVIRYARRIVNLKKHSAIFCQKRLG